MSAEVAARTGPARRALRAPAGAEDRLAALLDRVAAEPSAITAVRDPAAGVDVHVADSLVALDLPAVRGARRIADLGSGGGFPGLALAIALPDAHVALVESVAAQVRLPRRRRGRARARQRRGGQRARGGVAGGSRARTTSSRPARWRRLPVVVEYAAPLLAPGGRPRGLEGAPGARRGGRRRVRSRGAGHERAGGVPVEPFAGARDRLPLPQLEGRVPRRPDSRADREWPANGRYEPQVEGDGRFGAERMTRAAPTGSAASLPADGHGLRHCEPEGRRRQDDDGRQRRRLHRRGRLRRRCWWTSTRRRTRRSGWGCPRTASPSVYDVLCGSVTRRGGAVADGHRQPGRPALASRSGGGQRRASARGGLRAAPARGAGAAARRASPTRSWTARRRSARSRSTRSSPPTA